MSTVDIVTLNTGLSTGDNIDAFDANDLKIIDTKETYRSLDAETNPNITKPDESAKYRKSLAGDNPADINNTGDFARYLFIKSNNVGTNEIANQQVIRDNYMKQGAGSIFFTVA